MVKWMLCFLGGDDTPDHPADIPGDGPAQGEGLDIQPPGESVG